MIYAFLHRAGNSVIAPHRPDADALELLRAGRLQEAEHQARVAVAVAGSSIRMRAHALLAWILFKHGNIEAAEQAIVAALELSEGDGDA